MLDIDPEDTTIKYLIDISSDDLITSEPPISAFTCPTHVGTTFSYEQTVHFNPRDSYDPDGTIVLYEWDFDSDGYLESVNTYSERVSHAFPVGEYVVTLRVTDDFGLTDTNSKILIVYNVWIWLLLKGGVIIIFLETVGILYFVGREYKMRAQRRALPDGDV